MAADANMRIEPTVASSPEYLQKLLMSYERSKKGTAVDAKHVIAVWLDAIVEGEGTVEEKVQFLKRHLDGMKVASTKAAAK